MIPEQSFPGRSSYRSPGATADGYAGWGRNFHFHANPSWVRSDLLRVSLHDARSAWLEWVRAAGHLGRHGADGGMDYRTDHHRANAMGSTVRAAR